jgi:tellurite resistance protein TerC
MSALGWAATLALLAGLFTLDLVVSIRGPGRLGPRAAVRWSVFYAATALGFGVTLGLTSGWGLAGQYVTGYLLEKSLSVDNLFVFVIILGTFAVPAARQSRALTAGIVLALALRVMLIALGAGLLDAFSFMFLVFGAGLLVTAVQLFRHREEDPSVTDNAVVSVARRALPLSPEYDGGRLMTVREGRRLLTPMFLVLIAIGTTDLLFALDSIPAVFGVTRDVYVVFCANAFALVGLRALYFLVSGLLDRLVYLSLGLSMILALIGVKLVLHFAHLQLPGVPEISTGASLAAILVVLAVTTAASLRTTRRDQSLRAHAGALRSSERSASEPSARRPASPDRARGSGRPAGTSAG